MNKPVSKKKRFSIESIDFNDESIILVLVGGMDYARWELIFYKNRDVVEDEFKELMPMIRADDNSEKSVSRKTLLEWMVLADKVDISV